MARKDNLEYVSAEAVAFAILHHVDKLGIGEVGCLSTGDRERVGDEIHAADDGLDTVQAAFFARLQVLNQVHFAFEMVERDHVPVKTVAQIRDLIFRTGRFLQFYGFVILDGIISAVAEKSVEADGCIARLDTEATDEAVELIGNVALLCDGKLAGSAVGCRYADSATVGRKAGDRVEANYAIVVLVTVKVGAFKQDRVGKFISDLEIDAYRRDYVGNKCPRMCFE